MATKEDILEQIVEEYLVHKGYFVQHNLKFLPRKDHPDYIQNKDSNHSDIDVIGFPTLPECQRGSLNIFPLGASALAITSLILFGKLVLAPAIPPARPPLHGCCLRKSGTDVAQPGRAPIAGAHPQSRIGDLLP